MEKHLHCSECSDDTYALCMDIPAGQPLPCAKLVEVAPSASNNSDYAKCAREIIASVMSRCAEPAEMVIAEYLQAHFA
jgi:hypothetical protein